MNHMATKNQQLATSRPLERRALGGLMVRRYRWVLSLKAKLLILLISLILALAMMLAIYPFLALTERVNGDVLVVEGWVHPYAIRVAVEEFKAHPYRQIFTTGGPVVGKGGYINDYQTAASVGADLVKRSGISPELVQMVPCRVIGRDRTYSSAVALKEWFHEHDVDIHSLNIVTEGTHARRTRLLFEEALGPEIKVGVIAVPSPDYDARRWWRYSEGVEEVITEAVAYVYAKILFLPSKSSSRKAAS